MLLAVGVLFEEVFGGCGVIAGITAVLGGFDDFPNFLFMFCTIAVVLVFQLRPALRLAGFAVKCLRPQPCGMLFGGQVNVELAA